MRRHRSEQSELLAKAGSLRVLALTAACLAGLMTFLGSPVRLASPPAQAMGGASSPLLEPVADSLAESAVDRGLYYSAYQVRKGDTVGAIAEKFDVTTDAVISFNDIQNTRAIRPGLLLKIPSAAGILYEVKAGDSLESIAAANEISADAIVESNGLLSPELLASEILFLPDARLPSFRLREINGDLFRWPIRGWVTSRYGWRSDPFTGSRSFHNALDIGSSMGVPVGAAMEGRVADTGYSPILGNYVLLGHHSGYSSLYGHMSAVAVRAGQWVSAGQKIGAVGSTGYSTGPHLHFSVFKNGRSLNPSIVLH